MKVLIYPADDYGCGHHRLIWPAEVLIRDGYDVEYIRQGDRRLQFHYDQMTGELQHVTLPEGVDVVVFQRITDARVLPAITWLREHGVAVVMDVDDDLSAIHPSHVAFHNLNPNRAQHEVADGIRSGVIKNQDQAAFITNMLKQRYTHSWRNLEDACRRATLVTVSTQGLLKRYGQGHGRLLPNYAPDHYLNIPHIDTSIIGWPAALVSHPNDPDVVGNAIAHIVDDGFAFVTIGDPKGTGRAFSLREDAQGGDVQIDRWPYALTRLGIGIAPLADTAFNRSKSWLKPLEMSALGVPWVASPRVEYQRLNALGAGVLADKPKAWYRTLRDLATNPARRAELSEAGRSVALGLRLSANAWRHLEAWTDAYEIDHHDRLISAQEG